MKTSCSFAGFVSVEVESSPLPCVVSDEVTSIACGADFTVWLSSTEGASILYGSLIFWSCSSFDYLCLLIALLNFRVCLFIVLRVSHNMASLVMELIMR